MQTRAPNPIDPITDAAMFCTQVLFTETENLLAKWKHPDPYRPPTAPGGSKYERNIPAPDLARKFSLLHTLSPLLSESSLYPLLERFTDGPWPCNSAAEGDGQAVMIL